MIPAAVLAAGITAGSTLLGSKMNADASKKAAYANALWQAQENELTRQYNERIWREGTAREESLQREFAQNGIQWKAQDARAAGIHPLAALGAQTHSFSSSIGIPQGTSTGASPFSSANMGSGIASAGADISRALQATRDEEGRVDAYTKTVQDLTVQKMGMENALLASQIAKTNQVGPPMPSPSRKNLIDGQGNTPSSSKRNKIEPMESQHSAENNASIEPGQITETGHTVSKSNSVGKATRWSPVQSDIAKDRLEEDMIGTLLWTWRNRIMPTFGGNYNPPNTKLKPGKEWLYHPLTQEYLQVNKKPSRAHSLPNIGYPL